MTESQVSFLQTYFLLLHLVDSQNLKVVPWMQTRNSAQAGGNKGRTEMGPPPSCTRGDGPYLRRGLPCLALQALRSRAA